MSRQKKAMKEKNTQVVAMNIVQLLAGVLLIAFSFNALLNPNRIASGGVSGISTLVQQVWGIEPAVTQWALNLPIFAAGLVVLGRRFSVRAAAGSFLLPMVILLLHQLPPLTHNLLLASIFGGMGVGAGLGLVFRSRSSTGGLDLLAQIVHKYLGVSLGASIALLDGAVILVAGLVFTPEKAMYALIGLYVTSKTINIVQLGFSNAKLAFIITERTELVSEAVLITLDRGLTRLNGVGGFTGQDRPVLFTVVYLREAAKLKALVQRIDPNAFVVLSDTKEVLGEGFEPHR